MNIQTKTLNIFNKEVIVLGGKVTKTEAKMNGFNPGKMDVYAATLEIGGKGFIAYGYTFEDAVNAVCSLIPRMQVVK